VALDSTSSVISGGSNFRASIADRCKKVAEVCQSPRSAGILELLLDSGPGLFKTNIPFSSGARVSHLSKRLPEIMSPAPRDREQVRDDLVRPLRIHGALEPVTLDKTVFIFGHVPKSPNCAYRIPFDLRELLLSSEKDFIEGLQKWVKNSKRRRISALAAEFTLEKRPHALLIESACDSLLTHHLAGFRAIFVDDSDGDRISSDEERSLAMVGMDLRLDDAYPDAILINDEKHEVWFVEAVTSDGEIDHMKLDALSSMAERWGYDIAGATTAYESWSKMAKRMGKSQIAYGSSIWVAEQPGYLMNITAAEYA
jgi:hypothetical protein